MSDKKGGKSVKAMANKVKASASVVTEKDKLSTMDAPTQRKTIACIE